MQELSCRFARVGVVIPARNEETRISATLDALFGQTLQPTDVIMVNDCSTDNTKNLVQEKYPQVEVVDYPHNHESWQTKKELAQVFNMGIHKLRGRNLDYVMILGADHLLPENYLENILARMQNDDLVAVASGSIRKEFAVAVRGSGRVIDAKYFRAIGFEYPVNYGYESFILYKAMSMGLKTEYYEDIETLTQRQTAITYNPKLFFHYGQAFRALGYSKTYMLGVALTQFRKSPKRAFYYLKGFLDSSVENYDESLRKYVAARQWSRIKSMDKVMINHFSMMIRGHGR